MANTIVPIGSVIVGSGGASSIDFSSIPSTYNDLRLVVSARTNAAAAQDNGYITFNGSSSSHSYRRLYGDGSGGVGTNTASTNSINFIYPGATATASTFNNGELFVPNYASSSNKYWSIDSVAENNTSEAYIFLINGLWANTAAINQITISPFTGTAFVEHSSAYLYGIKNT
jgi:hypothetical protein